MKLYKNKFPYNDIETLLKPVEKVLKAIFVHKELPKWTGVKLIEPVHHVTLQPQAKLDAMADLSIADKLTKVLELAFQLGVCQGYALATNDEESQHLQAIHEALKDISKVRKIVEEHKG